MNVYSLEVAYAYIQLGLDAGASLEKIQETLANARAYRFSTRERIKQLEHIAQFFIARSQFGALEESFLEIRRSYHRQVLELHPDRNSVDRDAEERLKIINASHALVSELHREAQAF